MSSNSEIILAQEQSALYKVAMGREIEGTLVLTNKRLLFVVANKEENMGNVAIDSKAIRYADVDDLNSVPADPSNLSIPLESILGVDSQGKVIRTPEIKVRWRSGANESNAVFAQTLIGGRKKNLNDWAKLIDDLRTGKRKISIPATTPARDTLEGKIFYILGDLQEKGPLEIEEDVEEKFSLDLDPDDVQAACDRLAKDGLVLKNHSYGLETYKRISPLGKDDPSS